MEKSERIFIRISPEQKGRAEAVKAVTGKSLSTILREAIDRLARRHGVTFDEGKSEKGGGK